MSLLRYVTEHNQQVIGALVVIIIVTAILLLMRTISQEKNGLASPASGAAAELDIGAIETAFKRVLAAQGGIGSQSSGASSIHSSTNDLFSNSAAGPSATSATSSERDSQIQDLAREIDRLTAELATKAGPSGFGGTTSESQPAGTASGTGSSAEMSADNAAFDILQTKIAELEAKLNEYEIIEDDIADLSRFKEENEELRRELEGLRRNATATDVVPPSTLEVPVETASTIATPDAEAMADEMFSTASAVSPEISPKIEPTVALEAASEVEPESTLASAAEIPLTPVATELDAGPYELVMKESALSVDIEIGKREESVLDESLDTEKMLAEVASLSELAGSDENTLLNPLDADRLLAEAVEMPSVDSAPEVAAVPADPLAPAIPPAPLASLLDESSNPVLEDDLLAEFKESTDGGQG